MATNHWAYPDDPFYARCLLRRQARDRRTNHLSIRATSREPPNTGLQPSVIASLPVFVYKGTGGQVEDTNKTECTVCLSSIEDGEMGRLLPNCKHMFHVDCIGMWLSSHSTCPICRTRAEPQPQAQAQTLVGVSPTATLNSTTSRPEFISDAADQTTKAAGSYSHN